MAKKKMSGKRARKKRKKIQDRQKEFKYYGHTAEELRKMSLDDISKLLPSRARRTLNRGLSEEQKKFLTKLDERDGMIRTHLRNMIILPKMFDRTFGVYNGSDYVRVDVTPEMIGHYLGEFAPTRKEVKHSGPGVGATRSSKYMPLK